MYLFYLSFFLLCGLLKWYYYIKLLLWIQHYTQTLVDADRASLFQVDHHSHELYARIFDVHINDDITPTTDNEQCFRHKEIRWPSVARYIAKGDLLRCYYRHCLMLARSLCRALRKLRCHFFQQTLLRRKNVHKIEQIWYIYSKNPIQKTAWHLQNHSSWLVWLKWII